MVEGLRARKKRATENAIEQTAVRLALEKGHANVTVPEICEGADISRSTFFNYMPNREAAIFGRPLKMIPFEEAWALMEERAEASVLRAIYQVALRSVGQATVNAEVAAGRSRLGMEQPDTAAMLLAPYVALSTDLTGLLYVWLDADPSRRLLADIPLLNEAIVVVSVIGSALQSAIAILQGGGDTVIGEQAFIDAVRQIEQVAGQLHAQAAQP
ncbi:TetR/AcrR family transcriptional regulator [Nocardioides jishulii]|uniref:TetR family transcriptional regulator n=1 Tax=Nocardioides jishulii TaxID=2575440 RepID=A0A4V5TKN1_9ACTN|nr:TetR/AcrR family transcriptional regulator [Nocardioides jishulii]QCX28751.1 TetR family transcriptional regulator [Nocardioides jishulii]TKI64353.1 TetR family transcriptional regulator [Nocardioides jishulii]